MLSDAEIRRAIDHGGLVVSPIEDEQIQPASIDLRLASIARLYHQSAQPVDPTDETTFPLHTTAPLSDPLSDWLSDWLLPGEFVLGSTIERVALPLDIGARIEGKSTLGRLGLVVHVTAGYVDPGFDGTLTLELLNVAQWPIRLSYGMRIAQLSFDRCGEPSTGYRGRYQGQDGVTPAR